MTPQASREICLVDTSVLVCFIKIPLMEDEEIYAEFVEKLSGGQTIFLPLATIFETGNHIGQIANGNKRRICAELFIKLINQALDQLPSFQPPFVTVDFLEPDFLQTWIGSFPDYVTRGIGLGDVSIIKDWEKLKKQHSGRRVHIWSKDQHLQGYDYVPIL